MEKLKRKCVMFPPFQIQVYYSSFDNTMAKVAIFWRKFGRFTVSLINILLFICSQVNSFNSLHFASKFRNLSHKVTVWMPSSNSHSASMAATTKLQQLLTPSSYCSTMRSRESIIIIIKQDDQKRRFSQSIVWSRWITYHGRRRRKEAEVP